MIRFRLNREGPLSLLQRFCKTVTKKILTIHKTKDPNQALRRTFLLQMSSSKRKGETVLNRDNDQQKKKKNHQNRSNLLMTLCQH